MVSRLEAALSLALIGVLVCSFADWDAGVIVAGVPFVALLVAFAARTLYRRQRGASWDEAWGRRP